MLTDRIRLSGPGADSLEPEDLFYSSLSALFPDDILNQHGDATTTPIYLSPRFGNISLALADPQGDSNSLFAHFLWNAGLQLAEFVEEEGGNGERWEVEGKSVLELGAGTGLAGIVAALRGAGRTIISDYPAVEVLENIRKNVVANIDERRRSSPTLTINEVIVEGHEWGVLTDSFSLRGKESFEVLLVADCLWMPRQHENLLKSIRWFLAVGGRVWVVAGFHTGREKMRGFYEKEGLVQAGLEIEAIWERNADGVEREWVTDRGIEDVTERKRWLVVAILKRIGD